MPALILRGLPMLLLGFGLTKVDDLSEDLRAAAPWLAGAALLYLIAKRG